MELLVIDCWALGPLVRGGCCILWIISVSPPEYVGFLISLSIKFSAVKLVLLFPLCITLHQVLVCVSLYDLLQKLFMYSTSLFGEENEVTATFVITLVVRQTKIVNASWILF